MTRARFGKTWWGGQWLEALSHIDFDNRLPRGRRYANQGAVRELAIKDGAVRAQVQGSRLQPYAVNISIPALAPKDTNRLLDRLAAEPALIARLLNRQLDPAVLDIATALKVQVFPQRWTDLKMQCTCPDWAVPCKHLAAVIYVLSRQIDDDPFLVFSLRGLDLAAALRGRGIHIEHEARAALPTLAEWLLDDESSLAPGGGEPGPAVPHELDFSVVPALLRPLWRVLPANPAFFGAGDFREVGQRIASHVAKSARRALESAPTDEAPHDFHPQDRPVFVLDAQGHVALSGLVSSEGDNLGRLAERLDRVAAHQLADLQPQLAGLHKARVFAWHLLAQGAVIARVHAADGAVGLRWLPAMLDATVYDLVARLAGQLPEAMVLLQAQREGRGERRGANAERLHPIVQASVLCGLFLDHYVRAWCPPPPPKLNGDKVLALFFSTGAARFDGPGEGAMAAGIQTWLSRLHLTRQAYTPLLCLQEEQQTQDFALTVAVDRGSAAMDRPVPLSTVLSDAHWAPMRYGILRQVSILAEFFAPLTEHVRAGAVEPVKVTAEELPALLFDTLPAMRVLGVRTLLPKALDRLLRPRLSMQVKGAAGGLATGFLHTGDVLAFDWKIAIGDQLMSRAAFERLVKTSAAIVRFKGEYVYLDPLEIERLRARLDKPPKPDGAELLRVALGGEYNGATVRLDARAQALMKQLTQVDQVPVPRGLRATLRPYQLRGYAWLYRNARLGVGSVIADDMGLGKTLQVIAVLQKLKEEGALADGAALVIVPTSVLTNWQKELGRFAPTLSVGVFHGSKRELGAQRPDVLLTSYGVVRREIARLKTLSWCLVVVDEAQNIKTPSAAQTKAIKALTACSFIAMSGTPVENRLSEYWSIMDFANRGYLGSLTHFVKEYAIPIQTHRDAHVAQRFKRVAAPFVLRRLKSDKRIISDLPDKIEQDQYCALTPSQAALYESVVQEGLRSLEGVSDTFKRQGLVLQLILALKQVCNHPTLYLKQGSIEAALSGKAERLMELVDEVHALGEKALVFTQFREMGELLCDWLAQRWGQRPPFLHGGVSRGQRDAMVERFQSDRTERVFVLSLKAGGTGLNLTAASHVIHFDLWWNPAVQSQATDRAYRIGQQRNVQVHRFITTATFEERINQMINSKRELADMTVTAGEQWIGHLPNNELRQLFARG